MNFKNANLNGVAIDKFELKTNKEDLEGIAFNQGKDTLYITAADTAITDKIYRKTKNQILKIPTPANSQLLLTSKIFKPSNKWIKDVALSSAELLHLDSTNHSHFMVQSVGQNQIEIKYKKDVDVIRPKELVEIKANLQAGENYQLSYLKDGVYYSILNSFTAQKSGMQRLTWFDVNRLQGNTQFMLTRGNSTNDVYYKTYNLYVGTPAKANSQNIVHSLFGELSVSFPENSLNEDKEVTVRTSDISDYPFDVFNHIAVTGPAIEVKPSMNFEGGNYPRIQMKIPKAQMDEMHVTPQTLKLYKVDFVNKKLVALENTLYGYLDANEKPFSNKASDSLAQCKAWNEFPCYRQDYAYLLISAETKSFSVFAALDSKVANAPQFDFQILPEIAMTTNRKIQVIGLSNFKLYVDDDSLWNDKIDLTPAKELNYTLDSIGLAQVNLPMQKNEIDTNYIFAIPRNDSLNLSVAPVFKRALTVNENFNCDVSSDSLWLGLDNGYLAFYANCNHPGYGILSLYQNAKLIAEKRSDIADTIFYDSVHNGKKISSGIYESRYLGLSALGNDLQIAGPKIYTDTLRPQILSFDVEKTNQNLKRTFKISAKLKDSESGIKSTVITPVLGNDTLQKISMIPDSNGTIETNLYLNQTQLSKCNGCKISLNLRVEDYGHNYSEKLYRSDTLLTPVPYEDEKYIVVIGASEMIPESDFEKKFSCSVLSNDYFASNNDNATIAMPIKVEHTAMYNVILYARAKNLKTADILVNASSQYVGRVKLTPKFQAVKISGVMLFLNAQNKIISFKIPKGVEIAGVALTTENVQLSEILWKLNSKNINKVKAYVRFEGFSDSKMLRPRIRLVNISDEPIHGYSVRYYFNNKSVEKVRAQSFYPQTNSSLLIHPESENSGYVEWSFANDAIDKNDSAFYGQGPHFGLYNVDWSDWNAHDDNSFIKGAADNFVENDRIIVLDNDNNLIGGSCRESEDSNSTETKTLEIVSREKSIFNNSFLISMMRE